MVATEPIEKQGQELSTRAYALAVSIKSREQYQEAGEMRNTIKAVIDKAVAHHKPIIDKQTEALKAAKDALKSITEPLEQADRLLKDGRSSWAAEEERKEQELRRKEDEERRRIAAEKAAELRRQLEEQARLERERVAKEEEARRLAAAEEAEAKGATAAEVNKILDTPPFDMPPSFAMSAEEINAIVESEKAILETPAPAVKTAPPVRYIYSAEVVNLMELLKAIVAGTVTIRAVEAHGPTLNKLADAAKEGFNVPGCRLLKRPVDNRRTK